MIIIASDNDNNTLNLREGDHKKNNRLNLKKEDINEFKELYICNNKLRLDNDFMGFCHGFLITTMEIRKLKQKSIKPETSLSVDNLDFDFGYDKEKTITKSNNLEDIKK